MSNLERFSSYSFKDLVSYVERLENENRQLRALLNAKEPLRIENVDISTRTLNCLRFAGYVYLKDVAVLTHNDLLKIRGLGRLAVEEIERVLRDNGFACLRK